jgi:hypothetical protein
MERSTRAAGSRTLPAGSCLRSAMFAAAPVAVLLAGCKSDLSQQLLERELRMQEDQIYQLQDELQEKCARLDRVAGENSSLRRQLGVADSDQLPRGRGPARSSGPANLPAPRGSEPPIFVPPAIAAPAIAAPPAAPSIPGMPTPAAPPAAPRGATPRGAAPASPGSIAPPALEGVPPLPAEPRFPGAAAPERSAPERSAVVTASAEADVPTTPPADGATAPVPVDAEGRPLVPDADARGSGRPLSNDESLAVAGRITHLVVNAARTECFDGDGDGASDGLAIVFEPRDGDERLVNAAGDVTIAVFDAANGGPPLAAWEIPALEAVGHFRRTSRNRGLHFVLRWPGPPPQGAHVRIAVSLTTFDGGRFETDCTLPVRQARPAAAP